tara:strand:+ start:31 stop:165 length:135 start_codon:yes stop_codon:yes gene_type:complete
MNTKILYLDRLYYYVLHYVTTLNPRYSYGEVYENGIGKNIDKLI